MLLDSKYEVDILGVLVTLWTSPGPQVSLYWFSCTESCEFTPDWSYQVCLYTHLCVLHLSLHLRRGAWCQSCYRGVSFIWKEEK